MADYLKTIGLSLYMLVFMWWKFIAIFPFLFFRRRHLVHKLRFAILGLLICYTVDLVVPRFFLWFIHWPLDSHGAVEWVQVWMIVITITKIVISAALLFFLCKYYEKSRQPSQPKRSGPGKDISIYQSNKDELIRYGIIAAAIGFILVAVLTIMSIKRSTSSTAAIGYLFLPMESLIWSIPFFIFGYSIGYLKKWHSSRVRKFNIAVVLAFLVSIVLFLAGAKFAAEGIYLTWSVHDIKTMNESELRSTIKTPFFGRNKFILGAVAQNKASSRELLDIIGRMNEKDLHERMWSLFDIMGDNSHGLAVMRLVARHPNVLPETLEHLAKSSNDYVLGDVAGNHKTSTATLIRLSKRKTYLIDWGLARNPSTPSDILSKLSDSDNEYTRAPVAQNPNTPLKDLEKLVGDHEWNVRRSVIENPNVSVDLLTKLSKDPDERVRRMVLFNKQVTSEILTNLTEDSDLVIRRSAKDALNRLNAKQYSDASEATAVTVPKAVTGNTQTPVPAKSEQAPMSSPSSTPGLEKECSGTGSCLYIKCIYSTGAGIKSVICNKGGRETQKLVFDYDLENAVGGITRFKGNDLYPFTIPERVPSSSEPACFETGVVGWQPLNGPKILYSIGSRATLHAVSVNGPERTEMYTMEPIGITIQAQSCLP